MKLTIDEALQKGVTAYRQGKFQHAERLYRAILQTQPEHPDANYNLGILAISANKADAALPLFKAALTANPKKEKFWFSYIDALIKDKKFESAKRVIEQVKSKGMASDKLTVFEKKILSQNRISGSQSAPQKKNLTFATKRKRITEAKKNSKKEKKPNMGNIPPDAEVNKLLLAYQNKRFKNAEELAVSLTERFPKHSLSWQVLGALFRQSGRDSEAAHANQTAVTLSPQEAEAHSNLGITLKELGRLDEAETSYKQAIALKPDLAVAHSNLGNTLKELGRLDEAVTSYTQAITLKPDYTEAHNNLGNTLKELGRLDEAVASYTQAITLKPDYTDAYKNLGIAIENVRFNSSNPKLYQPLIQMLTNGNFTRPKDVASSILSLLKHDPLIIDLLFGVNVITSLKKAESAIEKLNKLPLLHHLMRVCPLPELRFEELFVAIRSLLLKNLEKMEFSSEIIYFLSTLSMHCFTNEYVYIESDEETQFISELQAEISQTLVQSEQPEALKILCLASYRSLHQYEWCQKLECLNNLKEVRRRLIEEPLSERVISRNITKLGEISDNVSLKVREQYEENPYPRWVKLGVFIEAKPIASVCNDLKLDLHSKNIKTVTAPFILIAGCGTGQHSIQTASRFSNCHVTAVDLSLASLAYAKRKTDELGFTNIDYLQADILDLHQIDKEFDIIESAGVLHHMDEPTAGWKVLVDLLKPGGLMKIGLYSELARHQIVEARKEIAELSLGTSVNEIRNFRELSRKSEIHDVKKLSLFSDFFSLSEFRDLVFNVQEHRFTLPQIQNCLNELGLKFCGFENKHAISNFRELHWNDADILDLAVWHQYEQSNPSTFVGMYQFWCQKL